MTGQQKIGFLGGTFDPFHLGHLNLIIEALEKKSFDQIWVCPAFISPFKTEAPPISIHHRKKMIELALDGLLNVSLIDIEALEEKPSYTYETLKTLQNQHKDKNFTLIISDDLLNGLEKWHKIDNLLEEFEILVARRVFNYDEKILLPKKLESKIKNKILPVRPIDVSSSEIRTRLKNNLYCGHLLHLKTLDYIYKNKLYS